MEIRHPRLFRVERQYIPRTVFAIKDTLTAKTWIPFLKSRVDLGPYLATYGEIMSGLPSHVTSPPTRTALMVDQSFVNNVLDRYKSQQIALRDIKPALAVVEQILALLDKEIRR